MITSRDALNFTRTVLICLLVEVLALRGNPLTAVLVGLGCFWVIVLLEEPLLGVPMGVLGAWGGWLIWTGGVG